MTEINMDAIKGYLVGLTVADHMGDVNHYLPLIAKALGLPEPIWNDKYEHFEFPWEDYDHDEEDDE